MVVAAIEIAVLVSITFILWLLLRPTLMVKDKKEIGVSRASMIYSDEKGTKLLYAEELGLKGKPDMVFQTWLLKKYVPVEIKSGKLKEDTPHLGDVYQLVAYFLIIEEVWGKRPPYGKLIYANKTFKIRNTRKLRREVKEVMHQMREMLKGEEKVPAEPSFIKCKNCICRETVCTWCKSEKSK